MIKLLTGILIGVISCTLSLIIWDRHQSVPIFKHIDLPDPYEIKHITTDKNNREALFGYQSGDTLHIEYKGKYDVQ